MTTTSKELIWFIASQHEVNINAQEFYVDGFIM
jgi:hypothetical protein